MGTIETLTTCAIVFLLACLLRRVERLEQRVREVQADAVGHWEIQWIRDDLDKLRERIDT